MITNSSIGSYGRLGNQMFQFAFLIAQARRLGTRAFINKDVPGYSLSPFSPERFADVLDDAEYASVHDREIVGAFAEPEWDWNAPTMAGPDRVDYRGYFQSARYFDETAYDIRTLFRPNVQLTHDRAAVHIRLGDYGAHPTFHTNLQHTSYYRDALALLEDELGPLPIVVFSDDIPWCRNHLRFHGDVVFSEGLGPHEDLWLMSQCAHHVIANSSFSWWGAWLANAGRVIAPAVWFGPDGPPAWDGIYCPEWTVL